MRFSRSWRRWSLQPHLLERLPRSDDQKLSIVVAEGWMCSPGVLVESRHANAEALPVSPEEALLIGNHSHLSAASGSTFAAFRAGR